MTVSNSKDIFACSVAVLNELVTSFDSKLSISFSSGLAFIPKNPKAEVKNVCTPSTALSPNASSIVGPTIFPTMNAPVAPMTPPPSAEATVVLTNDFTTIAPVSTVV